MLHLLTYLAQYSSNSFSDYPPSSAPYQAAPGPFPWSTFIPFMLIALGLIVIGIASMWKLFKKAGRPGWAAIVPVYNLWTLYEITGFPGWLAVLSFVPFINFVGVFFALWASFRLAKAFGKGTGFAVASIFFPYVCYPILAFGDATYQDPGPAFGGSQPGAGYPPQAGNGYPQQPSANPYNQPVAPAGPMPQDPNQPSASQSPQQPQPPIQQQPPQPPAAPFQQ